jgi:hypothetical protein
MMMDLAWAASNGQSRTTISKSALSAALSAALLNKISDFPDDFAVVAGPVSPIAGAVKLQAAYFVQL